MGLFEKTRELTTAEWNLGWDVFWDTIPYERIMIGDHLGFGDCPWMESVDMPGLFTGDVYILHLGATGYPDATSKALMPHDNDEVRNCFIHELTHVWQSYHGAWVFTRSIISRVCAEITGEDAYSYESGLEWNEYNVEQQAKIVEDWFKTGMSTGVSRYDYIRDHIRNC